MFVIKVDIFIGEVFEKWIQPTLKAANSTTLLLLLLHSRCNLDSFHIILYCVSVQRVLRVLFILH